MVSKVWLPKTADTLEVKHKTPAGVWSSCVYRQKKKDSET